MIVKYYNLAGFQPDHSLHMPALSPLSYGVPACSGYARDKFIDEV